MPSHPPSTVGSQSRCPAPRRKAAAESPFHGPTVEVYKRDWRSHVWCMRSEAGAHVIKRFIYYPLRQRAAWLVGAHPAQREWRRNRALQRAGVPVAPIVDAGVEPVGVGCHAWLITPRLGESLHHLLKREEAGAAERERWIDAAAALTRRLMDAGYTFRDLKPSNIVVDAAGQARLLDVGSVRGSTSPRRVRGMLAVMDRVLARGGVEEALRRRYAEAVGETHERDGAP